MDTGPAPSLGSSSNALEGDLLVARRPLVDDARFDITAMVDLVFMMNIFFLVSWIGAALAEVDLPAARHCVPADADSCVVVTLTDSGGAVPSVYLGDARAAGKLSPNGLEEQITAAVEAGVREGKTIVLIKAEKNVRLRDVARIGALATAVKGIKLNLAVMEKE